MEEGQNNKKILSKIPQWMKNPFVILGSAIVIIVIIYLLVPYFKSLKSPFTQYKPLPIDSTYIKLDNASEIKIEDTLATTMDTSMVKITEEEEPSSDSTSIADLFKLNTDYDELDPNEQVDRVTDEEADDLFSKLVLTELDPDAVEELQNTKLELGIQPVLNILSSTAVEMLSDIKTSYQLEVLQAIELSPSVQGVIISDRAEKVVYATNRKFMNQYLFELFPRNRLTGEKLIIKQLGNLEFISLAVHHRYGKIGTVLLILEDQ
jgi:hypothetical protein